MATNRRNEFHKRRVRKMKMHKLRARFTEGTATEKEKILEKAAKIAPWLSAEEFKKLAKA
jgi:hypothetical protein